MIISRTPLRISFVGGGTDLPAFYKSSGGAVVTTAINKYIFITVNKKFDHKIRISYSKTEIVDAVSQIKHELVKACLKKVGIEGGIEITSIADIPAEGTGLGSSSSFVVGLLNALFAFKHKFVTAEKLAQLACEIEIKSLNKPIGKQDQYIAAYGGLKFLRFNRDNTVNVDPVICSPKKKNYLQNNLLLFFTGITRNANVILAKQNKKIKKSNLSRNRLKEMLSLAQEVKQEIETGNINNFGTLINKNWQLKKTVESSVTNDQIDTWISSVNERGAVGAKILGAGGGGFLLVFAPNRHHEDIIKYLSYNGLRQTKFRFEPEGSKIIYFS